MKKIISVLSVLFLLFFTSCDFQNAPNETATAPPQTSASEDISPTVQQNVSDYFPFSENTHMIYSGDGNEYAEYETYVDYKNNDTIQIRTINPGTESVSVYMIEDNNLKLVYFEGETYYRVDQTSNRQMDEIVIKGPIEEGTSWILNDGSTRSITSVDTETTVAYGTFDALEITTNGDDFTIKDYYVAGIGLVKSVYSSAEDPTAPITSELESIEEGVPLAQNIRIYYTDFEHERLVYLEQPILLYTGDEVQPFFEESMKQIPESSALSPLLSVNTEILDLHFDKETAVVTVNFSSALISEMNAGSTLENLILMGIADTFGFYFQTDKVSITIEGNPYESGHFYFQTGDFLPIDLENAVPYETTS